MSFIFQSIPDSLCPMNSTTTPFGPDFVKGLIGLFSNAFAEGQREAAQILWSILLSFLVQDWLIVILVLLVILFIAWLEAYITRRWKFLGSVLYNYLYFGILFLIGLIFGPNIFASDYFDLLLWFCIGDLLPARMDYYIQGWF